MECQPVLQSLQELKKIHDEIIDLSKQKTEILKKGSAEKLHALLMQEQRLIHRLEFAEKQREKAVNQWFSHHGFSEEEQTITRMLQLLTNEAEKKELERVTVQLTEAMTVLKQQEQLNQALLHQSLQLIDMSLNMMRPTIEKMNYERPKSKERRSPSGQSVFDSKA